MANFFIEIKIFIMNKIIYYKIIYYKIMTNYTMYLF